MKRKTACILILIFSLCVIFLLGRHLFIKNTLPEPQGTIIQSNPSSPVPSSDNMPPEDTQPDASEDEPAPFQAIPTVPDPACFTYEELADGTLRITGYNEKENTQNPYQVIIPSTIDGKPVSTLGTGAIASTKMLELVISEGITTLESRVIASGWHLCLVALPDSVIHIDEQAFCQKNTDYAFSFAISCDSETSYAYEYAVENGFACQLVNPVTEENAFLQDYATGSQTSLPYHSHIRKEGSLHDYVAIEYRDIAYEVQEQMNYNNEFAVLVLDKESGAVLQCIDSSSFDQNKISLYDLPEVDCQYLLSIADYNSDGNPDLCLYQGVYGTGAFSLSAIFLFDKDSGLYTESGSLEN